MSGRAPPLRAPWLGDAATRVTRLESGAKNATMGPSTMPTPARRRQGRRFSSARALLPAMTNANEWYVLRPPQSSLDWAAYHWIRWDSIFALYLPEQGYDEQHPDEFKPGNRPQVLVYRDEVVGTVRIDLIDPSRAGLRLIGIRT